MTRTVNFILASNNASSITRVVLEYANQLADKGLEVHISYPVFSFWDHNIWRIERETASTNSLFAHAHRLLKFLRYLVIPIIRTLIHCNGLRWQGTVVHRVDSRVQFHSFWVFPTIEDLPDADVIVVMQNYFIPRLFFLPASKGKIIGSVHMDYQEMLKDRDVISRDWWKRFLLIDQQLRIPRFAVSEAARKSAEALGIHVDRVINNGVNSEEFNSAGRTSHTGESLSVMLFCALLFEKGQDFGCEVVRELRKIYNEKQVKFISIGKVKEEYRNIFDKNLGYLDGKDYVHAYQRADIFIYPSLRDGFPAPPLEAMACGAVLATTAVQGVVEYAVHGENCMVTEPNNIHDMVSNVQRLIEDPALRKRLRHKAFETVQKYSWGRSAEQLIDFMNDILHTK